ncbi:MAG: hypothetical protein DI591_11230 [Citromicrobium sp.]|nr:MAG: hypothetical protein DI591_11230 [Citromicrobium sp.]
MSKNILIFSDGTGQFGGLKPDQRLSNIYKLYRAARPGVDTDIDPAKQVASYDAGLGTGEAGANWLQKISRIFGAAFGTGISDNIADCYEAIIKAYEPGDRIYLFGFSRGAYTARCVANVMNLCGVPSSMPDGSPVPRGGRALRKLAEEAVFEVYEHGSGHPREKYESEREEKARRFRAKYDCTGLGQDGEEQGNVAPYFVGVFDTVASLGAGRALSIIMVSLVLYGEPGPLPGVHGPRRVCLGVSPANRRLRHPGPLDRIQAADHPPAAAQGHSRLAEQGGQEGPLRRLADEELRSFSRYQRQVCSPCPRHR